MRKYFQQAHKIRGHRNDCDDLEARSKLSNPIQKRSAIYNEAQITARTGRAARDAARAPGRSAAAGFGQAAPGGKICLREDTFDVISQHLAQRRSAGCVAALAAWSAALVKSSEEQSHCSLRGGRHNSISKQSQLVCSIVKGVIQLGITQPIGKPMRASTHRGESFP